MHWWRRHMARREWAGWFLAAGVLWQPITLDQALERAKAEKRLVMVDVWAEHCGECRQMAGEVWGTDHAALLTRELVPIQVNSVSPEGGALMARYPVTAIPAIIFLRPDGTEVDRVVGYTDSTAFFAAAEEPARGVDPILALEERAEAHPESLAVTLDLLDGYLDRTRDADAGRLLDTIMVRDADNRGAWAERALSHVARYQDYFRQDRAASYATWKKLAETYPGCSSIAAALEGVYRAGQVLGKIGEWTPWACDLASRNPHAGNLQYAVAMAAYRNHLHDPCLAQAARAARAAGVGSAKLDSIAVILEK